MSAIRVIIIDDEKMITRMLKGFLEDHGFVVQTAGTAREGLEIMEQEHFDAAIELCLNTPQFTPNEADLQVASMQAKSAAMKVANTNVTNSITTLSNNRISRDEVLYTDATSIFELARLVKLYVKSLYGQGSPQFNQISGLKFTKPRGL